MRADGTSSLRNGYGFSWRLNPFDNQLQICDKADNGIDCLVENLTFVSNLPFIVGQTVNFEMLIFGDNAMEVRLWAGARPCAPTLTFGPHEPIAPGSNLAIVESTRDSTFGAVSIEEIVISTF